MPKVLLAGGRGTVLTEASGGVGSSNFGSPALTLLTLEGMRSMSVSEGSQAEKPTPGLPQLGGRLIAGALLILVALLISQRWGASDRAERESFAPVSGTIRISNLEAPVEVLRDVRGIPHLIAERESEGWFALGFAHAQDRLAQMAFLRRQALGRAAELRGEPALRADRLARLLEIGRASEAVVADLPASSLKVLEFYSAGVNARIDRVRQGRVRAPRRLQGGIASVADWRPADSIAVVKLLSWCIGGTLETTLVLDDLIQRLDSVPARPFFPGRASVDFGVAPDVPRHPVASSTGEYALANAIMGATEELCEGIGIPTGGAWAVEGSKTVSGAPILVADWHFAPTLPSLFYEAHLDAGAIDVAGATMPGSPIFWAGRNPNFAWASVPASAPISDLFMETLRDRRGLYQNGTLWVPVEAREETVSWMGPRGELIDTTLSLRSTRHGPLIESLWWGLDEERDSKMSRARSGRALSWTGAGPGDGLTSMLGLLRAGGSQEIPAILEMHHEPVLAFTFADAEGEGGVQVAGWLPNRPLPTGLVPVQGRLRSFDWREPVSLASLPGTALGESGRAWVMALDQPWSGRGGLDQTEWLWRPGDRATRLELALDEALGRGSLTLRSAADLLFDAGAPRATRVVTAIDGMARRGGPLPAEAQEVATLLKRWDGRFDADSAGAAAYHLAIEHLLGHLLREPFGDGLFERYLAAPHVQPQTAVERLILRAATLRQPGGWTDESVVTEAARASLRETWVSLNQRLGPTRDRWSWGGLHRVAFERLGRTETDSSEGYVFPASGSGQTLSFTRHRPGISFDVERTALYRVAIDLGSQDRFLSSLTPGQSEHPGHPHFVDGISRWTHGRLALFATSRLVIEEQSAERLVLEPAP